MNEQQKLKDDRVRFFVQYWGVKCLHVNGIGLVRLGSGGWNIQHEDFFLKLTPISKLSDDDAIEYFDILWHETHKSKSIEFKIYYGKDWANNILSDRFGLIPSNVLHGIDFLRSKGYAIPFMKYTVEDLVKLGWVHLD